MALTHRGGIKFEDVEAFSQELENIQRYSPGNQLRASFFGQDVCVQTDVSELPLVKNLSDETAELVKEMEVLKEEIAAKVKFIEAQYESRLQQEAEHFYTRVNYKVKAFEDHYKEKITVLRNSYRQQFTDAIEVVKASYKRYCTKEGEIVEVTPSGPGQVEELLTELQEKDYKIECLSEQLRKYEISSKPADDPEESCLRMENSKLKEDVDILHIKMKQIRQALEAKDQSLKELALNLSQLKSKAEADKMSIQKLSSENCELKVQLNLERENGKKQKLASEKRYEEERLAEHERQRDLLAQEAMLNTPKAPQTAAPIEEKGLDSSKDLAEVEKLRGVQKSQSQHIDRLEKKISMINQAWEKKFDILRQSYHAIKDEMFLRQSLQRQATALHQASVSYTMTAPVSFQSQCPAEVNLNRAYFSTKTPLPSIGTREMQRRRCKTLDIYFPSGQTDAFSTEERQLVSEDDSDEESTKILPHPPPPQESTPSHTTLQVQNISFTQEIK